MLDFALAFVLLGLGVIIWAIAIALSALTLLLLLAVCKRILKTLWENI